MASNKVDIIFKNISNMYSNRSLLEKRLKYLIIVEKFKKFNFNYL